MLPEAEVPGFQAAVSALAEDFQKLAAFILRALAASLGNINNMFTRNTQNKYMQNMF